MIGVSRGGYGGTGGQSRVAGQARDGTKGVGEVDEVGYGAEGFGEVDEVGDGVGGVGEVDEVGDDDVVEGREAELGPWSTQEAC